MTLLAVAALIFGCGTSSLEPDEAEDADKVEQADAPSPPATPDPQPAAAEAPAPSGVSAADVDWEAALTDPSLAVAQAPDQFKVRFETTKGHFVVEVHRDWAPVGADRFYNLVMADFFEDVAFFRTVDGFMTQFGIHGDPAVSKAWQFARIKDERASKSNTRGRITFAKTGLPNSRTTQMFINYVDNSRLDKMGFAPFGEVVEGMDVVDSLHKTGEGPPTGRGPSQGTIQQQGNAYLRAKFPDIDYIESARVVD